MFNKAYRGVRSLSIFFQIFYMNTQTGERSNELPTEADSDTDPLAIHDASSTTTLAPSSVTSVSSNATAVASPEPPAADFGLPKRSGTPEPWVKRLADDGMSYYYLNTVDASIRWTAPSPQFDSLPQESFSESSGRQRADSSATRDRTSIYTDDSDSSLLGILGRGAAAARPTSKGATTPTPGNQQDDAPEVRAAKDLQAILQDQFSPTPDSLEDLAQAARAAVTDLLDAALVTDNNTLVKDAVKRTADAVRNLVYASKTLVGSLSSLPPPYTGDSAPSDIADLKNFHRKVTATMVKFVSVIRSLDADTTNDDTPRRLEHEAGEVERAITAFVNEVLRKRSPNPSARHVRAVLRSDEGRRGIGVELLGAGAAGTWKGFGFVDGVDGRLGPEILETVNHHKAEVDNTLLQLESVLSAGQGELSVVYFCIFSPHTLQCRRLFCMDKKASNVWCYSWGLSQISMWPVLWTLMRLLPMIPLTCKVSLGQRSLSGHWRLLFRLHSKMEPCYSMSFNLFALLILLLKPAFVHGTSSSSSCRTCGAI